MCPGEYKSTEDMADAGSSRSAMLSSAPNVNENLCTGRASCIDCMRGFCHIGGVAPYLCHCWKTSLPNAGMGNQPPTTGFRTRYRPYCTPSHTATMLGMVCGRTQGVRTSPEGPGLDLAMEATGAKAVGASPGGASLALAST